MWIGILLAAMTLSVAVLNLVPPSRQAAVNSVDQRSTVREERAGGGVTPGEKAAIAAARQHRAAVELFTTRLPTIWWTGQYGDLDIRDIAPYYTGGDPPPESWGIKSGVHCITSVNWGCYYPGSVWVVETWIEKGPNSYGNNPSGMALTVQTRAALPTLIRSLRREVKQFPGAAGVLVGSRDSLPAGPGSSSTELVSRWTSVDAAIQVPEVASDMSAPYTRNWGFGGWEGTILATPVVKPQPPAQGF